MSQGINTISNTTPGAPPPKACVADRSLTVSRGAGVEQSAGAPQVSETAPRGLLMGRQPGAACKADPAQRASTAALRAFGLGRGIASAEGSEARQFCTGGAG